MFDLLLKNATVFDGTGSPGKKLDVAIAGGKIAQLAEHIAGSSRQTLDAAGNFLAPGFIDIQNHSDSYCTLFDQPEQVSLLAQGITSIVVGNCGSSLAPLLSGESIKSIQKWHNLAGINVNWASVGEFLDQLAALPLGVNVGTLVGHATLRRGILRDEIRATTADELKILDQALRQGLAQGALGLSMGLVYAHEVDSSQAELEQLTATLKESGKYLSVHLRSEGSQILESLDEVIGLCRRSQVPVKISHLKIRGRKNWPVFNQVMEKLEAAYHQGLPISFDVYPYQTSWTVAYTYLPKWAYEGGRPQILSGIADPDTRRRILDYLKDQSHDFDRIIVAEDAGDGNFVGKTLRQIAQNQNVSSEEALLNVIAATSAQVLVFDHNLSPEQVSALSMSPLSLIATDGAGYAKKSPGLVHPRCFGTMPRFLKMVRENGQIKWEDAIRKLTSEPAKLLGLTDRGILKRGAAADLAVFDPQAVGDRADYLNPDILPDGIELVLVNGQPALQKNKFLIAAGTVIKR